ncbi:MAG: cytochrome c [Flavobacteriia bacterium]|nr:cytochrome c [Flavobacteriia bacterium]
MHKKTVLLDEVDVNELPVELVLENLKGQKYSHKIEKIDLDKVEIGRQIIFDGKAKKGKRISPFFVCTDCHNTVKETELLKETSPEKRLEYAQKNNLPFLQGSTFWGIYNRTSFYNDDYIKKYKDIIKNAKDSLSNAIQVCGKYCSSGRYLNTWELEAVLHYFKKNELKIKDLSLDKKEYKNILYWQKLDSDEKKALVNKIESAYSTAFPATFLPTMPREQRKYGEGGNVKNGEFIYEKSCMYCHENKRVTFLSLSKDRLSAKMFVKHLKDYSDLNLYQIIRWGTYAKAGRKQYMPHYTKEKMSDQQIEDLVAYIKTLAKKSK